MARKRRVGRPRVKGGPRKMTNRSAKAYMNRGLLSELRKSGKVRGAKKRRRVASGGKRRGLKKGHKKSAAWKKNIGRGVARAWKRGAYKNRRRRGGARRRRSGSRRRAA